MDVTVPGSPNAEALSLMYGTATVRVGDDAELAFEQFPRPTGAITGTDEPPVKIVGAKVKMWDRDQESLAVLSLDGRVIVAVYSRALTGTPEIMLERYTKRYGQPSFVTRPGVDYRFWGSEDDTQALMVCWARNAAGTTIATTAVGLKSVMHELRMDPASAEADALKASSILARAARDKPGTK